MLEEDPVIVTAPHYDKLKKLLDSDLHEALKLMPKPAVHHAHISGCVDIELLIKFTYYNYVYYSAKENKFHVNKNGCKKDGYLAVNALRSYAASAKDFDNELREKILLQINHREDNNIWKDF
jgi:hypothetical protein